MIDKVAVDQLVELEPKGVASTSPEAEASRTFESGERVESWADASIADGDLSSLESSAGDRHHAGCGRSRGERSRGSRRRVRDDDGGAALGSHLCALGIFGSSGYRLGTKIGKGEFVPIDSFKPRNSTAPASCPVQLKSTVPRCVRRRRRSVGWGGNLAAAARRAHACVGTQHVCACTDILSCIDEPMRGHLGSS